MAKITPQEAIQRLTATASRRVMASPGTTIAPLEFVRSVGVADESVYLLRKGTDGFVVPGDDTFNPCVAETEDTDYTIDLPPCYEETIEDYAREVEWWQTIGQRITEEAAPVEMEKAVIEQDVTPLIKTKWNQTAPWNQNLTFEGKKCLAGCVPISIGQLLYYWWTKGFSRGCMASPAYKTSTNIYEVEPMPAVPVFDFAHMVIGKPTTAASIKAVADMLEHIGKAVRADYKPTATGTKTDYYYPALSKVFRLGDNITQVYASKIGLAAFCERIRKDLEAGRPVMMTGCNSARTAAHSFICDGYRADDDKFHYNWGWGGTYNGWFKMGALTPTASRNYSYYKHCFLGLQPAYKRGDVNRDGVVDVSDVLSAVDATLKGEYKEEADVMPDGKMTIDDTASIVDIILGKNQ